MLEQLQAWVPDGFDSLDRMIWVVVALMALIAVVSYVRTTAVKRDNSVVPNYEDVESSFRGSVVSRAKRAIPAFFVLLMVGILLTGLVVEPFKVSEEPYEQATFAALVDSSHTSTAIDREVSGSIRRIDSELLGLSQFVEVAPEGMAISVTKFDTNVVTMVPGTSDKAFLQDFLARGIETGRFSYIGEALYEQVDYLRATIEETTDGVIPARIVLFTDGLEQKRSDDGMSLEEASIYAAENGIKVYPVVFGHGKEVTFDSAGTPTLAGIDHDAMQSVADTTGGRLLATSSVEELTEFFSETASSLGVQEVKTPAMEIFVVGALVAFLFAGLSGVLIFHQRKPKASKEASGPEARESRVFRNEPVTM